MVPSTTPRYEALMPRYRPGMPSERTMWSTICVLEERGTDGLEPAKNDFCSEAPRMAEVAASAEVLREREAAGAAPDEEACRPTAALRAVSSERSAADASSCRRVLTTQMGLVAVAVTMP
jgi:hypothetical protein